MYLEAVIRLPPDVLRVIETVADAGKYPVAWGEFANLSKILGLPDRSQESSRDN